MLGTSLAPTFFIFALFFHRLVVHKRAWIFFASFGEAELTRTCFPVPARESIVSLFLPLGPCVGAL